MNIHHAARTVLVTLLLGSGVFVGTAKAQDSDKDLAAAVEQVKQVEAGFAKPGAKPTDANWNKMIDIHASGWLYKPGEKVASVEYEEASKQTNKVIKAEKTNMQLTAVNKDTVVETWLETVYYEVPNPQDVWRAAMANPAKAHELAHPPGEGVSPNPYRNQHLKVWSRVDGKWKVSVSSVSAVRERVVPGRF